MRLRLLITVLIQLALLSCTSRQERNVSHSENKYALGFSIQHYDDYKLLTVHNPWQSANNIQFQYVLAAKGTKLPAETLKGRTRIDLPVQRIVCMSTTHLGLLEVLNEEHKVVGLSGTDYASNLLVRENIEKGLVKDVGYESNMNFEHLLSLKPDLVISYGISSEVSTVVGKLRELGIPVVLNADYLENTPLGKAEWIKYMACFFNKEELAEMHFDEVEAKYKELKHLVLEQKNRPKVLTGLPWKGTWYVPGGRSFFANYIKDAGGDYLWSENTQNESIPLSIELIFEKAAMADVWLNMGTLDVAENVLNIDERLGSVKAYKQNQLYNNTRRSNEFGGNDFWESGISRPDLILKDLICIFHPSLLPEHEFVYYKKLE